MGLLCFSHPTYRGKVPPILSCRACCQIFLSEIKRKHRSGEPIPTFEFDAYYRRPEQMKKKLTLLQFLP